MLWWSAALLAVAIIAAIFGFGGLVAGLTVVARALFFLFLIFFFVSIIVHLVHNRPRRV